MIILYGIPNCETVKKARAWLTARGLQYVFHDFKKQGVPVDRLEAWIQAVGVDNAYQPPRHNLAQAGYRFAGQRFCRVWRTDLDANQFQRDQTPGG